MQKEDTFMTPKTGAADTSATPDCMLPGAFPVFPVHLHENSV
jgi:hypothetical protein